MEVKAMIRVDHLTKSYGKKVALDEVSLSLDYGCVFGLVGTNGAGKSTLLRVMSGLLKPDSGSVLLDDKPVFENADLKNSICYITDEPTFISGATIQDMDRYQKAYFDRHDSQRLRSLCMHFSLPMEERISGMSKGTQKRVQICLALARHPKVILCDETFDGLDPVMREMFKSVLGEFMLDEGLTTILAGHSLQEMEDICDSVGFVHDGKLLTSGDMEHVLGTYEKFQVAYDHDWNADELEGLNILKVHQQGRLAVITAREDATHIESVIEATKPAYFEIIPLSLEEIFILEMEEQGYAK